VELSAPGLARRLAREPRGVLATLAPDGRAALVPVVFAHEAGVIWSPIDGKPKAPGELARVRHAERDPRVALLLDRYAPDWSLLWWIRVEGRARVLRAADEASAPLELRRAGAALRAKYPQYAERPLFRDPPTLLCVDVAATRSWASSREAQRAAEED
jgi:PPOX class probable F420-dependent enzyme